MPPREVAGRPAHSGRDEIARHENGHLRVALENTNYVVLLSKIYEISSSSGDAMRRLNSIKTLIDEHNLKKRMETKSTTHKIGPLRPPLSSSDSTSLETFSTEESSIGEISTEESGNYSPSDDDGDKNKGLLASLELNQTIGGTTEKTIPGKEDPVHDSWIEFSLEEELEGIADAPAQDRAAMRVAMHKREKARKKWLLESAAEKRRIAEREGQRLQRTLKSKVSISTAASPAQQPAQQPAQHKDFSARPQVSTTAPAEVHQVLPIPHIGSSSQVQAIAKRAMDEDDDDEEDGENRTRQQSSRWRSSNRPTEAKSPGIINITGSPPRNVDRFGIEFTPTNLGVNQFTQESHRRSVLIQNIPHSFSMHKLLSHVHGGTIVSARLLPETLSLGSGQTGVIVFAKSSEASLCCRTTGDCIRRTPVGKGVKVSLLPMPTYPTRESLAFEESDAGFTMSLQRQTRCLLVGSFPKKYVNELCIELLLDVRHAPMKVQTLEEMWFEGDTLHINFTSIREAVKAYNTVKYFYFGKFSMQARFGADPCSLPMPDKVDALGNIKLASHGCVGLKSLIETVGLAAYSRSHRDEPDNKANSDLRLKPALTPAGFGKEDKSKTAIGLFDDCINGSALASHHGTVGATMPWTDELMKGLELF